MIIVIVSNGVKSIKYSFDFNLFFNLINKSLITFISIFQFKKSLIFMLYKTHFQISCYK